MIKLTKKAARQPVKKEAKAGVPAKKVKRKFVDKGASMAHDLEAEYHRSDSFKFIDLFCGIGGFHIGFSRQGGECVFASDWDKYSQKTYAANFPGTPLNGDITKVALEDIPKHNVLCAGFPCQPFSIAGVSKKNSLGRKHGFEDERQGNLFFNIAAILEHHRPEAFVLENVKNLKSHDKGNTLKVIMSILEKDLGYKVQARVLDAQSLVPQHRERIFIVGFREERTFEWPTLDKDGPKLGEILDPKVPEKYTLTDHLWQYLQNYAAKHKAAGNGFGFGLVGPNDVARTLSARYHKDGSEILINQGKGKNPRRLTIRECARLMGYPESYKIDQVSDTQAYRQFGNSVVVPVVERVAEAVIAALKEPIIAKPKLVMEFGEPVTPDYVVEAKSKSKAGKTKEPSAEMA
jgi:DNA (cytosine-5)-methyltransferase 1